MSVFAIADLHLSFGVPDKKMDVFGKQWENWTDKIEKNWKDQITDGDLVLLAGDLSWALKLEDAQKDLEWMDKLPGTKVLIRGNHDYWWSSVTKMKKILPPSIHVIQNDSFRWKNIGIAGARLWDTPEYNFNDCIQFVESDRAKPLTETDKDLQEAEKIFGRELNRLDLSLKSLPDDVTYRIVMTHYPPIGADLQDSRVSKILEKHHIDQCVFGHLHSLKKIPLFGEKNGIKYSLTSCDYLDFKPKKIF